MMNIGSRPTFGGDHRTLEAHIMDFDADIYGQPITVMFISRLRSEQRFDNPEMLKAQLAADAESAKEILTKNQ